MTENLHWHLIKHSLFFLSSALVGRGRLFSLRLLHSSYVWHLQARRPHFLMLSVHRSTGARLLAGRTEDRFAHRISSTYVLRTQWPYHRHTPSFTLSAVCGLRLALRNVPVLHLVKQRQSKSQSKYFDLQSLKAQFMFHCHKTIFLSVDGYRKHECFALWYSCIFEQQKTPITCFHLSHPLFKV